MKCNKEVKCNKCEMLYPSMQPITFIDDSKFMHEDRVTLQGFKCCNHGGYALNLTALKNKPYNDDMIYGQQAAEIIKQIKGGE